MAGDLLDVHAIFVFLVEGTTAMERGAQLYE